jgi:hypothetical protein
VPTEIGRLTELEALSFSNTSVTGTLPSQINNLSKMEFLFFQVNKLVGSLPELDRLTSLRTLFLQSNVGLNGTMPALPASLRDLRMSNCSFTGLPPNLSSLTLIRLQANQNRLVGAPPVLAFPNCSLQFGAASETNCLDCPANNSAGQCACFRNAACASLAPTMTTSSITVTAAAITQGTSPTTTKTTAPISISATPTPAATTMQDTDSMEPWIVGVIVVGAVTTVVVVVVAVFVFLKRRAAPKVSDEPSVPQGPAPARSEYGFLPVKRVYADGRIDLDSDSASAGEGEVEQAPNSEYTTVLPSASDLYRM